MLKKNVSGGLNFTLCMMTPSILLLLATFAVLLHCFRNAVASEMSYSACLHQGASTGQA
jgi:hypothetical protein